MILMHMHRVGVVESLNINILSENLYSVDLAITNAWLDEASPVGELMADKVYAHAGAHILNTRRPCSLSAASAVISTLHRLKGFAVREPSGL